MAEPDAHSSPTQVTCAYFYGVLGLDPGQPHTANDVRLAYKKAALHTHPDKGGSDAAFQAVNQAHLWLKQHNGVCQTFALDDIPMPTTKEAEREFETTFEQDLKDVFAELEKAREHYVLSPGHVAACALLGSIVGALLGAWAGSASKHSSSGAVIGGVSGAVVGVAASHVLQSWPYLPKDARVKVLKILEMMLNGLSAEAATRQFVDEEVAKEARN